jgi:hypothetical protein
MRGVLVRVDHVLDVPVDEAALVALRAVAAPEPLLERRERALVVPWGDQISRPLGASLLLAATLAAVDGVLAVP